MTIPHQLRNTYATTETETRRAKPARKCRDCGKGTESPRRVRCDHCYIAEKSRKGVERNKERAKELLEQEARVIGDALGINFAVRRMSLIRAVLAARDYRNSNRPRFKPVEPE